MMQKTLACCLAVLVVSVAAGQDPRPEDVIDAAILAAGGADALKKYPAGRIAAKGKLFGETRKEIEKVKDKEKKKEIVKVPIEVAVEVDQVYQLPDRSRTRIRTEDNGQKQDVLHIVNGAKTLYSINGAPVPTTEAAAKDLRQTTILQEIGQLTPLLSDKKFTLKPDRSLSADLVGVLVQVKGGQDVRLGFDRTNKHLVKIAWRGLDPESGKDVEIVEELSDFKPFGVLIRPSRAVLSRDGKKFLDLTTASFTPLENADPRDFVTER